jgi:hypothetical protein
MARRDVKKQAAAWPGLSVPDGGNSGVQLVGSLCGDAIGRGNVSSRPTADVHWFDLKGRKRLLDEPSSDGRRGIRKPLLWQRLHTWVNDRRFYHACDVLLEHQVVVLQALGGYAYLLDIRRSRRVALCNR